MVRLWIIPILAAGVMLAQERPAFEAASIKVNASGLGGSSSHGVGSQVVMTNMSLQRLIERAYNVRPFQVSGPAWLENVHFDIAAKYPPNTKSDDRPAMLQALLAERLKLTVHHETRELPGYALVAAKSGFKLKPVEKGEEDIESHGGSVQVITAKHVQMADLAENLTRRVGSNVADRTGLEGAYNFQLTITIGEQKPASDVDANAAYFSALQEALSTIGLRLQAQKIPMDVIVVDHVERAPTEN